MGYYPQSFEYTQQPMFRQNCEVSDYVGRASGLQKQMSLPNHYKLIKIERRIIQLEGLLNGTTAHDARISMKIKKLQAEHNEIDPVSAAALATEARKANTPTSSWAIFGVMKFVRKILRRTKKGCRGSPRKSRGQIKHALDVTPDETDADRDDSYETQSGFELVDLDDIQFEIVITSPL